MHIVVIGAGLSGLTAAWELHKAGHEITVLEAKNRVGGRTWSEQLPNGQLTERGGEYIFPGDSPIRRLAAELEVPLLTHSVRYHRRTLSGTIISFDELERTVAQAKRALRELLADDAGRSYSVDDVFAAALGSDFRRNSVYRRTITSVAADPARVNAEAVLRRKSAPATGYVEDGGRLLEGNQSLTIAVAARLGDAVRLEHPVSGLDSSAERVQVRLTDGSTHDADAAVLSVPLPQLRTLELGFRLSPAQQNALDHRFMGVAAKLGVPLGVVDDDPAVQSAEHAWWSWQSLSRDGVTRVPALSCFAGGPAALGALQVEEGPAVWLDALRRLRPSLQADGEPLLTTWADDPWTQGSYSAASLDWRPEDADVFTRSAGRVAIAGEHTGISPSMSSAVESGYRAAAALSVELAR